MNLSPGILFSLAGFVVLLIIALLLLRSVLVAFRPEPGEVECSWKFRTVVYVALSLAVPLWPLTFPLFLLLAHRSYLAGAPRVGVIA